MDFDQEADEANNFTERNPMSAKKNGMSARKGQSESEGDDPKLRKTKKK